MKKIITIDGPSGVGKGTIARILTSKLGWNLLDSGAIYRALALLAMQKEIELNDEVSLVDLAINMDLRFEAIVGQELLSVYLRGQDVSTQLRTQACGESASQIAKLAKVRATLLQRQRNFATENGLIADGRDMGTIVFPKADFKVFLTASSTERAKRRLKQLQTDIKASKIALFLLEPEQYLCSNDAQMLVLSEQFITIESEIRQRDKRDEERKNSPLIPATDALVIDTTQLSIEQVVIKIEQLINI